MNKIAQEFYKLGSRLALTKHLPKLSRNQLLVLGGAGGGLGALALGLSAAEGKALAKGLVDDVVSATGKSGLADDVVSAAGKSGLGVGIPERDKALNWLTKQLEMAKGKDYRNYGYYPDMKKELVKSIKESGSGLGKYLQTNAERTAFLKKQFPGKYQQLDEALWARSKDAYQAASKGTISELEGIYKKLNSPGIKPEEVSELLRRYSEREGAFPTSRQHATRQIRAAVQDLIKAFSKKQ